MLKSSGNSKWKRSALLLALGLAALGSVVVLYRRGVGDLVSSSESFQECLTGTSPYTYDHNWDVVTYTANFPDSGTDDDLKFCADNCCIVLDNPLCNDWEEGHFDYFAFETNAGTDAFGNQCTPYITPESQLLLLQTDDDAWYGKLVAVRESVYHWSTQPVDEHFMVLSTDDSDEINGIKAVVGTYYKAYMYRPPFPWYKWKTYNPFTDAIAGGFGDVFGGGW